MKNFLIILAIGGVLGAALWLCETVVRFVLGGWEIKIILVVLSVIALLLSTAGIAFSIYRIWRMK